MSERNDNLEGAFAVDRCNSEAGSDPDRRELIIGAREREVSSVGGAIDLVGGDTGDDDLAECGDELQVIGRRVCGFKGLQVGREDFLPLGDR